MQANLNAILAHNAPYIQLAFYLFVTGNSRVNA
jgi:hypothetical protein